MLELHHNNMSVCAQKVRLVLAEKRLSPVEHHLNLRAGDQLNPAYLALNPMGVVPTLVVDGRPIIESTLIAEYLDEAHPEPSMRPADLVARAEMRRWANIPDQGLHAACGTVSSAIAFRHQYLALSADELERNIAETPDPARRERKRQTIELGLDAPGAPPALRTYDNVLARMQAQLADGRPWLMGEQYTLADVAMTPYLVRLDHLQLAGMWADRPGVTGWLDRIRERANFSAISNYITEAYMPLMAEKGAEAWPKVRSILAG